MNRSALVVIADFLLLSILSLAKFDQTPPPPPGAAQVQSGGVDLAAVSNLVDIMRASLEQERLAKEQAEQERLRVEQALLEKERLLAEREKQLQEQQKLLAQFQQKAQRLAQQQKQLMQEIQRREQELQQKEQLLSQLQQQHQQTLQRVQQLQKKLELATQQTTLTESQIARIEQELAARREEARKLQEQIQRLIEERFKAESEKEQYAVQLAKVQTAAQMLQKQLDESRQRIQQISQEKAQLQQHAQTLAQGVTQLAQETAALKKQMQQGVQKIATQTEQIKAKIEEAIPWPPNRVFAFYRTNSLIVAFKARRKDLLGRDVREFGGRTILFQTGTNVYALFHVRETPFGLFQQPIDWDSITATIGKGLVHFPIQQVQRIELDPRLLVTPIPKQVVTNLEVSVFQVAKDPAQYQSAVVVAANGDYYGEVSYKLDPEKPMYLKVERLQPGGLLSSGKPVAGDLLLTRKGRLLGMMVNNHYAVALTKIQPIEEVPLEESLQISTQAIVQSIFQEIRQLPGRLR